jgi:glycosyltransferase involved in cell wall biosynthesis
MEFLKRIENVSGITYHGIVNEATKQVLFAKAHIFCLPSVFFEGQPISILEAYASGCAVMTTGQDGIRDIFADGINGYEIKPHAPASIALIIQQMLSSSANLVGIAQYNWQTATTQYRTSVFTKRITDVLISNLHSGSKN